MARAEAKARALASRRSSLSELPPEIADLVLPPDKLGVDFESVGGIEWVKDALEETVLLPLQRPELFRRGNLAKARRATSSGCRCVTGERARDIAH